MIDTSRRTFLKAAAGATAAATLPWDLALAEAPGGTLHVGMTASAVPLANGCPDQGAEGTRFMGITIYDQLIAWDLSHSDQPSKLIPCLATSWSVDPANQKRWTFKLREGVTFHDGKPFTAADVVFSFDRALKHDSPAFDSRASGQVAIRIPTVAKWGATDDHTFWLETSVVDATIPYGVLWVGITHQGAWEAAGKDWTAYMQKAVGTGPWKLQSFNLRERAVLVRNEAYWNKDRVPKCSTLILLPMPNSDTRVAALRSGQADMVEAPPPDALDSLRGAGFQVITNKYPHNWTWHLSMLPDSPWHDIRIRKAANLGIDRAGLKELLAGTMLEGAGLIPPGSTWSGNPTFKLVHDPDQARKLMAEAGYSQAKPLRTKVAISTSGSGQMEPQPMNEFIQQNLAEVGFQIEFEVLDWNALLDVMHAGAKSPLARGCQAINVTYMAADPYNAFMRLLKGNLIPPAGTNWGYYIDPKLDAMLDQVYQTFDSAKQDAVLAKVHEYVVDNALFLFAAHDLNPRALSPHVHGFVQAQNWFQDLTPITLS